MLDPQDGGNIHNAMLAPSGAIIDCAPYNEYALAALKVADNFIYILKIKDRKNTVEYLRLVASELVTLKQANEKLRVFIQFNHDDMCDDFNQFAIDSLSTLSFVEFGLPKYLTEVAK